MTDPITTAEVRVVLPDGDEVRAGTIGKEGAGASIAFRYDPDYLRDGRGYELSPDMPLSSGPIRTGAGRRALGAISDATPDEWGRRIIRASTSPRDDFDYLVAVSDRTRQGALRITSGPGGRYLSDRAHPAAQIHELGRVLTAARALEEGTETDDDLQILVAAGTSAGGARPKATVTHRGGLWMAKFSREAERFDPMAWEATALTLAARAGIRTAEHELHRISEFDSILLTRRFDRDREHRIGYLSAHSLTAKADNDPASYTYLADVMSTTSPAPRADLAQLYRRIALNLLIGNVDDHFRNHGFLRDRVGWALAPAFDIEPNREASRVDATPLVDGGSGVDRDVRELLDLHDVFGLSRAAAAGIISEVGAATTDWRGVAIGYGISPDTFTNRARVLDGPNRDRAAAMRHRSTLASPVREHGTQPRRGQLGMPGNPGSFASPTRPEGDVTL